MESSWLYHLQITRDLGLQKTDEYPIIDINKFSCLFIYLFIFKVMIKLKGKNIFKHTLLFTLGCCKTVTLSCR